MKFSTSVLVPSVALVSSILIHSILTVPQDPPEQATKAIEAHLAIPADVYQILQRSCYDCHSYRTQWPWYARLPGIQEFLQKDVTRARRHLNLSDWSAKMKEGRDEAKASLNGICEELRTNSMPITHYRWLHRNAGLSPAETEAVCRWTSTAMAH